jgi:hypothetical protein
MTRWKRIGSLAMPLILGCGSNQGSGGFGGEGIEQGGGGSGDDASGVTEPDGTPNVASSDDGNGNPASGTSIKASAGTATNGDSSAGGMGPTLGDAGADRLVTDASRADAEVTPDGGGGDSPSGSTASSACNGGKSLLSSDSTGTGATPVNGYGEVDFQTSTSTAIIGLQTTLTVPSTPSSSSTLFIWPGLEPLPGGANFDPVGQGVLQPVLTWGTSCAPGSPSNPTGWWISGQYVNPYTSDQSVYGCFGGNVIDVQVGDLLDITMSLSGTVWSQTVVDRQSGQQSAFTQDLSGQAQDWALFKIEEPTQTMPSSDIVLTSTRLTFAAPDPSACQPNTRGTNDYFATPLVSTDGTQCCISRIILRAQGVPATTPNGP